jgi:hypothetical protein
MAVPTFFVATQSTLAAFQGIAAAACSETGHHQF